ncbi:polysaccharide deacetylase family protein [Brumimicrobium glaciale]|uniref:Polysaccharide deacetylase family protein n=1 Tax=Brumimicrobium glaciale TaxID=200475 RepID=A0A4Q4KRV2_9FLAO|nr:polysaccharide deacetylase family protein [Brumimicrobium glaciale]
MLCFLKTVSKVTQQTVNKRLHKIPKLVAWIFPRRIWFGTNGNVCLTFDDGPHPEITPWLLDELRSHNIKATFFWQGCNIEKYPEFLKRAIDEGHIVGHHGFNHQSGKELSFEEFKSNFEKSRMLVKSNLFRPPYGDLNRKQAKYALNKGEVVMWSWMSYDFDSTISSKEVLQKAKNQIQNRDILIFHENEKTIHRIKEIIPAIIQIIHNKGLNFALVEK